jgi:diguanylate cyclase (GGDEF)-like protein/PAS domain S-box-containing protein
VKNEQRGFDGLWDSVPVGLFALDAQLQIVDINQTALNLLHHPRESILGKSGIELVHPEDVGIVVDSFGIITNEPWRRATATFRIVNAAGESLPCEINTEVISPPINGVAYIVSAQPALIAAHLDNFVTATAQHRPLQITLKPIIDAIESNGHYASAIYWVNDQTGHAQWISNDTAAGVLMALPGAVAELRELSFGSESTLPEFRQLTELRVDNEALDALFPFVAVSVHPVRIDGKPVGFIASLTRSADRLGEFGRQFMVRMTELATVAITQHQIAEQLRLQALTDPLTGIGNRTALFQAGEAMQSGSLSIVDVDHFKEINDTYGHAIGDAVIVELATRLRSIVGADGMVARLGGDEFAVILQNSTSACATQRLALAFGEPVSTAVGPITVEASIGSTQLAAHPSVTSALADADHDMYDSKRERTGRRRVAQSLGGAVTSPASASRESA